MVSYGAPAARYSSAGPATYASPQTYMTAPPVYMTAPAAATYAAPAATYASAAALSYTFGNPVFLESKTAEFGASANELLGPAQSPTAGPVQYSASPTTSQVYGSGVFPSGVQVAAASPVAASPVAAVVAAPAAAAKKASKKGASKKKKACCC
ncbi:unnamed protein product [Polarella glacialis]|uniref:Uncharacterized protein n=1 Tax=Polarella glacialis TaxID=89957 RepID=A0A813G0G8_POLGL|nr:unnamed protein product [Polarella glacialis]CAE8630950.1 unnamed protein product [Polarella glacialis]